MSGKTPKLVTFDKATFDEIKAEWKEQDVYKCFSPQFLFGIPFKVIDRINLE